MASDPRLSLSAFAQVKIGPVSISIGAGQTDSCPTSVGENLFATTSSNASLSSILPGDIGAFANLQLGLGGGTVGVGLTGLAAISDNIRLNGPPTAANPQGLPTSTDPNAGSEFVLQSVGLSTSSLTAVGSVNASVASAAHIQAGLVYNQVQSGTFTNANISASFSAFQNAHTLLSATFSVGVGASPQGSQFGTMCGAKPYALDLINVAPKYKFLFVVQFEFDPTFNEVLQSIDPAFVVKNSSRPQVDFEYQDINMYNFRTKVPSKTMYQPMTMKFYDDDFNNAFQFYATYMKLMSPISNVDIQSQSVDPLDAYENAGGGMGFDQSAQKIQTGWAKTVGQGYAGSLGPYGQIPDNGSGPNVRNVLRRITLFEVYKQGRMMNVYHFYNPKITVMNLSEMDMASTGEGSEVSITFAYDSVYIIPGYNILTGTAYNLNNITNDGIYPFGIVPGSVSAKYSSKDGTGRGGLDFGQNNVLANASQPSSSQFVTVPSSVSSFVAGSASTLTNSILANAPNVPLSGGGVNTATTLQGNTPSNLAQTTQTNVTVPDPVTGATPQSADNSGNVGNVIGQTQNNVAAANAAAKAANPTTVQQSVETLQTQQTAVKTATSASQEDTDSYLSSAYTTLGS